MFADSWMPAPGPTDSGTFWPGIGESAKQLLVSETDSKLRKHHYFTERTKHLRDVDGIGPRLTACTNGRQSMGTDEWHDASERCDDAHHPG